MTNKTDMARKAFDKGRYELVIQEGEPNIYTKDHISDCEHCDFNFVNGEEPDPCIGHVKGCFSACCGHGRANQSYGWATFFENEEVDIPAIVEHFLTNSKIKYRKITLSPLKDHYSGEGRCKSLLFWIADPQQEIVWNGEDE